MKLLITGSRKFEDYQALKEAIELVENKHNKKVNLIIHGGARGADTLAQHWAESNKIPTKVIRPDYKKYNGKIAPMIRNTDLVKLADVTLALYATDQRTGGTKDAADKTIKYNKPLTERMRDGSIQHIEPNQTLFD